MITFALMTVAGPPWRHYLRDTFEFAGGYSVTFAAPFFDVKDPVVWQLPSSGIISGAILALALHRLRSPGEAPSPGRERETGTISVAIFCILWLRYGLTRSDWAHLTTAILPSVLLCACVLPCYLRVAGLKYARLVLGLGVLITCRALLVAPLTASAGIAGRLSAVARVEWQEARLAVENYTVREGTLAALELNGDSLYVWPFQTVINVLSGKRSPAHTLQSYAAQTDALQQATIERLRGTHHLPVMLFTSSRQIDGVENHSRTSAIFRYLLEGYELDGRPRDGFALLRPAPDRRAEWRAEDLGVPQTSHSTAEHRPLTARLPVDCRASDLLELRMHSGRTRLFGFAKPGKIEAELVLSNGERRKRKLLLPPDGAPHAILVSALSEGDPMFLSHFARARGWRSEERVTQIELRWAPIDILSRRPRQIVLEGVSVLRRSGIDLMETTLRERGNPELWDWCYGEN